jgi:hypothetical protein
MGKYCENYLKIVYEVSCWIHLAEDSGKWRSVMKNDNEPSGSITGGEFLDQVSNYHLVARMWERRSVYRILVPKKVKGTPRRRLEYNT